MILKAKHTINLPNTYPLIVKATNNDSDLKVNVIIGNYQVNIKLILDKSKEFIKEEDQQEDLYFVQQIEFCVASEEQDAIPDQRDEYYTKYFFNHFKKYLQVSFAITSRLFDYFKYDLGNILPLDMSGYISHALLNITWEDEKGNQHCPKIFDKLCNHGAMQTNLNYGYFGITHYDEYKHAESLKIKLQEESLHNDLYGKFLVNARHAIVHHDYSRGIFEMAIAFELYVKNFFFRTNAVTSAVFEYLEEKREIEISVLKLLHSISKHAFGKSFKDCHPAHYQNIEYLFRARNKIAHQGECSYKDKQGIRQEIHNTEDISEWWNSIHVAIDWLSEARQV